MSLRRVRQWLRDLRQRSQWESDLDAELDFHLQARADQIEAEGHARGEALRRARIELGMLELHRDSVRAARGLRGLDHAVADLRYAVRGLRRSPAYTVTAILVLALPLAAAVLLHAIYATYALHAPPMERAERWVSLEGRNAEQRAFSLFTADEAEALVAAPPPALEGLYSARTLGHPLLTSRLHKGMGAAVSDNYFALMGVPALRGRVFQTGSEADRMGVVLSDAGWAQLFERAPDVVGRTLDIRGHRFSVIGVTASGFNGTHPIAQLYFIRQIDQRALFGEDTGELRHEVAGFLQPQASTVRATEQLAAGVAEFAAARPPDLQLSTIEVQPQYGRLSASDRHELILASAPAAVAVLLMLLIASANLANLVLARFSARGGELGVRAALGASRGRLLAQLLVECAVIGAAAAVLALCLAALLLEPIHGRVFGLIAELGATVLEVSLGRDSVLPALLLAALCTLAFGLVPALVVTRRSRAAGAAQRLSEVLRGGGAGRLRSALMVAQVAASCFLLVVAGLIAANARRAIETPLGYSPERLVGLDAGSVPEQLAARLRELPQVEAVGASSSMPLMAEAERVTALVEGRSHRVQLRPADVAWFGMLGLQPLRGRLPAEHEGEGSRQVVISRSAAERLWPGQDPLGRSLDLMIDAEGNDAELRIGARTEGGLLDSGGADTQRRVEVIGVVPDIATGFLFAGNDGPVVYTPGRIGEPALGSLLLRLTDSSPETIVRVHSVCTTFAPQDACAPFRLSAALRIQRMPLRVAAEVASGLGAVALLICCIGLYGLVGYGVQQRRRELGLRLALGAPQARVIATVMRGALGQIALGLAIGLPLAFVLSRVLAHFTDRLTLLDLTAFVGVPLLLSGMALLAAWLPARASARINLLESLRATG